MLPAIVTQVANQAAQDARGVVSAQYTRTFDVHAGPFGRHDRMVLTGVYADGNLVYVRIATDTFGDRDATPDQVAQTKAQYEHPNPSKLFRAPWDPRYIAEYDYRIVNSTTIAFTSLAADTAHGNGTFTIDSQDHVVAYRYTMSANWRHATLGMITGQRAEVLPGYWATRDEVQQYTGRYGLFKGGATANIVQSLFRRFATVTDARRASDSP